MEKRGTAEMVVIAVMLAMVIAVSITIILILVGYHTSSQLSDLNRKIETASNLNLVVESAELHEGGIILGLKNAGGQEISGLKIRITSNLGEEVEIDSVEGILPLERLNVSIPAVFGNKSVNYKLLEVTPEYSFRQEETTADAKKVTIKAPFSGGGGGGGGGGGSSGGGGGGSLGPVSVCGNAVCEIGEACTLCPGDCKQCWNQDYLNLQDNLHVLFINGNNLNCNDSYPRVRALNFSTPWCSPKALNEKKPGDRLMAGDSVYIKQGDYNAYFNRNGSGDSPLWIKTSGTKNQRMTFSAYPGEKVIIRAGSDSPLVSAIVFSGPSYTTVQNLHFVGYNETADGRLYFGNEGAFVTFTGYYTGEVEGLEIINSTFEDIEGTDGIGYNRSILDPQYQGGNLIVLQYVNNSKITNSKFRCAEDGKIDLSKLSLQSDGLVLEDDTNNITIETSKFYGCSHVSLLTRWSKYNTIRNNFLSNTFHTCIGLEFNSDLNLIYNNIFYNWNNMTNVGWTVNNTQSDLADGIEIITMKGYGSGPSYNKIFNNLFYNGHNNNSAFEIISNSPDPDGITQGNEIFNNLIYDPGAVGIRIGDWWDHVVNNKVYNNIIYEVKNSGGYWIKPITLVFHNATTNNCYGNEFRNNILGSADGSQSVVNLYNLNPGPSGVSPQIQKFYDVGQLNNFSFASNNSNLDPLFVDVANGDFHLKAGSPAIDSGICSPDVPFDFDGKPRPLSGCDVGPYEY